MPDTLVVEEPVTMQQVPTSDKAQDPFSDWSETPITPTKEDAPAQQQTTITTPASTTTTTTQPDEEETFDEATYLKKNFGWDTSDAAKTELERLRNLEKNPPKPEEIKFNDDESRRIFDLLKSGKKSEVKDYLDRQDRLDRLTQYDLSKADQAADILKAHMQFKYPDLTSKEVDRRISKMFPVPDKPINNLDLTPEENQAAVENWQRQVQDIEQDMIIEAKLVRPDLSKYKSELVLPDIQNADPAAAETQQKELAAWQAKRDGYLKALDNELKNFNGFNAIYKDEDVEIPIAFAPTEEEKTALKTELQDFNRDQFFDSRWFDANGNPKVTEIAADIYLLKNRDKILQKFANESGQKRLAALKKERSNITVGNEPQKTWNPDKTTEQEKQEQAIWSA